MLLVLPFDLLCSLSLALRIISDECRLNPNPIFTKFPIGQLPHAEKGKAHLDNRPQQQLFCLHFSKESIIYEDPR